MGTVLIIQSDPELHDGWSLALEACGHTVLAARDAEDGLERVREGGIDVIVFDTGASALVVTEFCRALDRLPDAPPFVLVSSSPAAPEISARIGASAFLPKPCSSDEVEEAVRKLAPRVPRRIDDDPTAPRLL